ncbi:hypothetical protein Btru_070806 [Bulinus truncatus]|nr:hypothetical protein Btru_070806 [Bulinus truncatus]
MFLAVVVSSVISLTPSNKCNNEFKDASFISRELARCLMKSLSTMQLTASTILLMTQILQCLGTCIKVPDISQPSSENVPTVQNDRSYSPLQTLPAKKNLKPQKLLKRMGNDFDPFWMSTEQPTDHLDIISRSELEIATDKDFRSFNLTGLHAMLTVDKISSLGQADGNNHVKDIMDTVRTWLAQQTTCPVYYQWEDVTPLYWPPWVRRGMCSVKPSSHQATRGLKTSSCSWPPGMHCVPGPSKKLRILRWTCKYTKDVFSTFASPRLSDSPQGPEGLDLSQILNRGRPVNDSSPASPKTFKDGVVALQDLPPRDANVIAEFFRNFDKNQKNGAGKATNAPQSGGARGVEDDMNATENWNKLTWREKKKQGHVKCKWVKIPYPVTDDCFCSC